MNFGKSTVPEKGTAARLGGAGPRSRPPPGMLSTPRGIPSFLREGYAVKEAGIRIGSRSVLTRPGPGHVEEVARAATGRPIEDEIPSGATDPETAEFGQDSGGRFPRNERYLLINAVAEWCDVTGADVLVLAM